MIYILSKTNTFTHNGGEFRNKVIESYLKENNIDHITGDHYNPQYQETFEVFNKTIQIYFI